MQPARRRAGRRALPQAHARRAVPRHLRRAPAVRDDGAAYFGPLRSQRLAPPRRSRALPARLLPAVRRGTPDAAAVPDAARCAGPCAGGDPAACAEAVEQARALLGADAAQGLARLGELAAAAAAEGRLTAPAARARLDALVGVAGRPGAPRRATARDAVLVERGEARRARPRSSSSPRRRGAPLGDGDARGVAGTRPRPALACLRAAAAAAREPSRRTRWSEVAIVEERLRQRAGARARPWSSDGRLDAPWRLVRLGPRCGALAEGSPRRGRRGARRRLTDAARPPARR